MKSGFRKLLKRLMGFAFYYRYIYRDNICKKQVQYVVFASVSKKEAEKTKGLKNISYICHK